MRNDMATMPHSHSLPLIGVTMGDPAGIGPEICLRLLAGDPAATVCRPVVFGDAVVLEACAQKTGLPAPERVIARCDWSRAHPTLEGPAVYDLELIGLEAFTPGAINGQTGLASYGYIEEAIRAALAGEIDGISTGPINKEALALGGIKFPGHTEIFAAKTQAPRSCMMLTSEVLTCSFVTTHIGYHEVPGRLTQERILDVIELTAEAVGRLKGRTPRLVVNGLNPHAGENGLFGQQEEARLIIPAIEEARNRGHQVTGPLPPDTAFLPRRREQTDAFVCMYHDQGLIPLKMLAFDSAINITLGLPIIRTSVDHGTALDIAWQGHADANSLYEAVRLAARLAGKPGMMNEQRHSVHRRTASRSAGSLGLSEKAVRAMTVDQPRRLLEG